MADTTPARAAEEGIHRQRDGIADDKRDAPDPERGDAVDPDRANPPTTEAPTGPAEQRTASGTTAPVPPGMPVPPGAPVPPSTPGAAAPLTTDPTVPPAQTTPRHSQDGQSSTQEVTPDDRAGAPSEPDQPKAAPEQRSEPERVSILGEDRTAEFQQRWREVQASFVDNPSTAVRSADKLVSEVVTSLTSALAEQQRSLGAEWREVPDAATEDLRTAMMRYRAVFQRLIGV